MARAGPRGPAWAAVEAGASALLSFVSAFAVARLIGPGELGVGTAAVALHVFLWVPVNALFADALVQVPQLTRVAEASAFWAASGAGVMAAGCEIALGPVLASGVGDPRLTAMSGVLGAALPLVGAAGPAAGVLARERRYRLLAGRTLIGQTGGTTIGVVLALAGAGAWALVLQQAATSLGGAAVLLFGSRQWPRLQWSGASVLALLRLGGPLTVSTLAQQGRYRLFAMLLAASAGAGALGQIHMAFRLVDTVRDLLASALWRLTFPVMSRLQNDLPALRLCIDRTLGLSALLIFPLIGLLALAIGPATALLLGPGWQATAEASGPLLLLMAYGFLCFPGGVATVARGFPSVALTANLVSTALTVAGVLVVRPQTPAMAAAVWAGAQLAVAPYTLLATARVLAVTPGRQCRAGAPSLLLAGAALGIAAVLPLPAGGPAAALFGRAAVAALVYVLGSFVFQRRALAEACVVLLPRSAKVG